MGDRIFALVWAFAESFVAAFGREFGSALATRVVVLIDQDRTAKSIGGAIAAMQARLAAEPKAIANERGFSVYQDKEPEEYARLVAWHRERDAQRGPR